MTWEHEGNPEGAMDIITSSEFPIEIRLISQEERVRKKEGNEENRKRERKGERKKESKPESSLQLDQRSEAENGFTKRTIQSSRVFVFSHREHVIPP